MVIKARPLIGVTVATVSVIALLVFAYRLSDEPPIMAVEDPPEQKSKPLRPGVETDDGQVVISEFSRVEEAAPEKLSSVNQAVGNHSIDGLILSESGELLPDIEVFVSPRADSQNKHSPWTATSDLSGYFNFDSLFPGDYVIRTGETARFASVKKYVRAGTRSVNIVLSELEELWVHGVVKDRFDQPLANVLVAPKDTTNSAYSDAEGNFGLTVTIAGSGQPNQGLHFSLTGYQSKRLVIRANQARAGAVDLTTIYLEGYNATADVLGWVQAEKKPVAKAQVLLQTLDGADQYQSATDAQGLFIVPEVALGIYEFTVIPSSDYYIFTQQGLEVGPFGEELSVTLQPVEKGVLKGHLVDIHDQPVADFGLWLTSQSPRVSGSHRLVSDYSGYFEIGPVPLGEVRIASYSIPQIHVRGVTVTDDADATTQITLDIGGYLLEGYVADSQSNPIRGAQVALIWSHERGGVLSHSARNAVSDETGYFDFSGIGPGTHQLNVSAAGFQRRILAHDVAAGSVWVELNELAKDSQPPK